MPTPIPSLATILIIEDDPHQAEYLQTLLMLQTQWKITVADTGQAALAYLKSNPVEIILLDIYLPDFNGLELLQVIKSQYPDVAVIAMTTQSNTELIVQSIQTGAHDFLEKPISEKRLLVTLSNTITHRQLSGTLENIQKTFHRDHFHNIVGTSFPMQAVFRIIENAAASNASVFITGESGTGKELCAEALHRQSSRNDKPFITLNCAAIPRELMESEIFGHVKGAFTGATQDREGAAKRADGGTLFFDEIGEMEFDLQSKLLRFFQTQKFTPVGGSKEESVDVRFISATNKDPIEQMQRGLFREDLFYRLHVIPIQMPPLRARGEDILLIAEKFLHACAKEENKNIQSFSKEVKTLFLNHSWPGNVRELQNTVRNIVVLNHSKIITPEMLPPSLQTIQPFIPLADKSKHTDKPTSRTQQSDNTIIPLREVEMQAIERAIDLCAGNIIKAAELLDINPSTIYRKRKRYGLD